MLEGQVFFLVIVFPLRFINVYINRESQLSRGLKRGILKLIEGKPWGVGAWMLPRVYGALVAAPPLSTVCGSCP